MKKYATLAQHCFLKLFNITYNADQAFLTSVLGINFVWTFRPKFVMTAMIMDSITLLIEAKSRAIWIYYPSYQALTTCFRLKASLNDCFKIGYYQTDMSYIIFN